MPTASACSPRSRRDGPGRRRHPGPPREGGGSEQPCGHLSQQTPMGGCCSHPDFQPSKTPRWVSTPKPPKITNFSKNLEESRNLENSRGGVKMSQKCNGGSFGKGSSWPFLAFLVIFLQTFGYFQCFLATSGYFFGPHLVFLPFFLATFG